MENKPTAAPWTTQIDPVDQDIMIIAKGRKNGGFLIGRAYGPDRVANAALIAAAPKLLDENQRLRRELEHIVRLLEPLEQRRALAHLLMRKITRINPPQRKEKIEI